MTLEENRKTWSEYAWPAGGHEWSVAWGTTEAMWHWTIYPRIHRWLHGSVLEIACGYGRITPFLQKHTAEYVGVDMTEKCVDACRARLPGKYFINDGCTLADVASSSIDFAFSWDSLVHADPETMRSYVHELARVLKPDGAAFIHHSNAGACSAPFGLRDAFMTAEMMRAFGDEVGLRRQAQELVDWCCDELTDCFSLLRSGPASREMVCNLHFRAEMAHVARASALWRNLGA